MVDVFGISKRRLTQAMRAVALIGMMHAASLLFRYQYFFKKGGKRPNIHGLGGEIIAPVCPQLVAALVDAANRGMEERLEFGHFLAVRSKRQRQRAERRARHEFRRQANAANRQHEEEAAGVVAPAATITPMTSAAEPPTELVATTPYDVGRDITSLVHAIAAYVKNCGQHRVLFRKFPGGRAVVVTFDSAKTERKFRTVYDYMPDGKTKVQKAGMGRRLPIAKLIEDGWTWGLLEAHPTVIEFIVREEQAKQAAQSSAA